jgi:hypothetical protein
MGMLLRLIGLAIAVFIVMHAHQMSKGNLAAAMGVTGALAGISFYIYIRDGK